MKSNQLFDLVDWFCWVKWIEWFHAACFLHWKSRFSNYGIKGYMFSAPSPIHSISLHSPSIVFINSINFISSSLQRKLVEQPTRNVNWLNQLEWSWWALEERQLITRKFKEKKQTQQTNKTNAFIALFCGCWFVCRSRGREEEMGYAANAHLPQPNSISRFSISPLRWLWSSLSFTNQSLN